MPRSCSADFLRGPAQEKEAEQEELRQMLEEAEAVAVARDAEVAARKAAKSAQLGAAGDDGDVAPGGGAVSPTKGRAKGALVGLCRCLATDTAFAL